MSAGGRIATGLLVLVVALLLFAVPFLDQERPAVRGSADSAEEGGRRAAFLLLAELGFAVEAWRGKPGQLPAGRHVLWMARAPGSAEGARGGTADAADPLEQAREGGLSSVRHYRGFVEQGGTLVLPLGDDERRFLTEQLSLAELLGVLPAPGERVAGRAVLLGGAELEVDWEPVALLEALDPRVPREVVLRDTGGRILALHVNVGRGGVLLLSSDRFLGNEHLPRADHALLLVRLLEGLADGGRILLDEHALGLGRRENVWHLAMRPEIRLFTLHAIALLVLLSWRAGWPRDFPRDPEPLAPLDPAARARAQAAWTLRAGRPELLAAMLRQGTLDRLLPRGRRGVSLDGAELAGELERLCASSGLGARPDRWRRAFLETPVADARALAELDRELRALEARVHAATRQRGDGARPLGGSRA